MAEWTLQAPWEAMFQTCRFSRNTGVSQHQACYEGLLTQWLLTCQKSGTRPVMSELLEASAQLWEKAEREALGISDDRLSVTALREAWNAGDLLWLERTTEANAITVEARWLVNVALLSVAEIEWLAKMVGGHYRDAEQSLQLIAYRSPLAPGEAPHTDAEGALRRILGQHLETRLMTAKVEGGPTRWEAFRRYPWWRRWLDVHITSRRVWKGRAAKE